MHATAVLGYLPKLKRGLGLASEAHFLHDFPIKIFLIQYSINRQSFNVITFCFSRYQTKCFIKFLFIQLMTSYTLRLIFNQPLKQWSTGRERGEEGNTKIWISREQKELCRWNKKHFSWNLKGYHLVRKTNLIKNSGHKL